MSPEIMSNSKHISNVVSIKLHVFVYIRKKIQFYLKPHLSKTLINIIPKHAISKVTTIV